MRQKRRHNPNLAKINRNYTVEEVASLYDVFKGTVRNWIKAGLPVLDDKRPMLILGSDLAEFHRTKNVKYKARSKTKCTIIERIMLHGKNLHAVEY